MFKNWNIFRIMRLLLAIGFALYAYSTTQYAFLLITAFLLLQVIFHHTLGCCCTTNYNISKTKNQVYKNEFKKYKP